MIEELRNFIRFSEKGIRSLDVSQEQFLSQIQSLENEIRHRLIKKIGNSEILLTEFGEEFVTYAKKSILAIQEGIEVNKKMNAYDLCNQITIGFVLDTASSWGLNCIKNFNKMHPGLRLILLAENKLTVKMLENANVIFWSIDKDLDDYDPWWYIEFRYGLYASPEYIKAHGVPTVDAVGKHSVIAYSGKDNNAKISNWHLYGEYGLPVIKPTILSQSRELIAKMVSEGAGIGALSDRQDAYYGYKNLEPVLRTVSGPVLRSYFLVQKGLNEQERSNVQLLDSLFRSYFTKNKIKIFEV